MRELLLLLLLLLLVLLLVLWGATEKGRLLRVLLVLLRVLRVLLRVLRVLLRVLLGSGPGPKACCLCLAERRC